MALVELVDRPAVVETPASDAVKAE
jgi:hypothetical protein